MGWGDRSTYRIVFVVDNGEDASKGQKSQNPRQNGEESRQQASDKEKAPMRKQISLRREEIPRGTMVSMVTGKNTDCSTGPLAHPFARSLTPSLMGQ